MPTWLQKQLTEAYRAKDRWQIRYLNECWISFQSDEEELTLEIQKTKTK